MWQDLCIYLIGIAVVLYVGQRLYRMLKHPEKEACNCGCEKCRWKKKVEKERLLIPTESLPKHILFTTFVIKITNIDIVYKPISNEKILQHKIRI